MQLHGIPSLNMLELGDDVIRIMQAAPDKVLKPGIAVEAAFILANLHEPGPDGLGGHPNGDPAGGLVLGLRDPVVPRKLRSILAFRDAPPPMPWPDKLPVKQACRHQKQQ